MWQLKIALLVSVVSMLYAYPQGAAYPAAGGTSPEGYFQFANVPAHKEYEVGWRKGNPNHYVSRFEQAKDHRFRTRVEWKDGYGGYGQQYWEYNHGPSKEEHKGYQPPQEPAYAPPSPYGKEIV